MKQQVIVKKLNTDEFRQEDINKLIETIKIKQISCGYYHILLLDQNNNIYACGRNTDKQLGLGHNNYMSCFEKVVNFNNSVKLIATGGYCSMIATLDNKIYEVGVVNNSTFNEIKLKEEIKNVKKMKCGCGYAIIMNENGDLFGCGFTNYNYQLGEPTEEMKYCFVKLQLPIDLKVKEFHCGYMHTVILSKDGDIYCAGTNINYHKIYKTFTKLDLNFKCKEIGNIYNNFYLLSQNNELYFYKQKLNFTKPIKRVFSGFSSYLYFLTEENEIYKVKGEEFSKLDEFAFNLKHLYIYPAYSMIVFLNSDFNIDEEESKEVVRMKTLLFKNVILSDIELKMQ